MEIFAYCWSCNKEYDVTRWSNRYAVKCDSPTCDGYVISPTGKIRSKFIGDFSTKPEPLIKLVN